MRVSARRVGHLALAALTRSSRTLFSSLRWQRRTERVGGSMRLAGWEDGDEGVKPVCGTYTRSRSVPSGVRMHSASKPCGAAGRVGGRRCRPGAAAIRFKPCLALPPRPSRAQSWQQNRPVGPSSSYFMQSAPSHHAQDIRTGTAASQRDFVMLTVHTLWQPRPGRAGGRGGEGTCMEPSGRAAGFAADHQPVRVLDLVAETELLHGPVLHRLSPVQVFKMLFQKI